MFMRPLMTFPIVSKGILFVSVCFCLFLWVTCPASTLTASVLVQIGNYDIDVRNDSGCSPRVEGLDLWPQGVRSTGPLTYLSLGVSIELLIIIQSRLTTT